MTDDCEHTSIYQRYCNCPPALNIIAKYIKKSDGSMMKIALLIFVHHNTSILKRFISAMDDPRFDIFIHVDAKKNIDDFHFETYQLKHSKLHFVPGRIRAYWGDISLSDAMISAYRYAMSVGHYDWFLTLSGEDYPIQSNDQIYAGLCNRKTDAIRTVKCYAYRYERYLFWKLQNKWLVRAISKAIDILRIKKTTLMIDGKPWQICVSSQWHALTKASVQCVIKTVDNHPEIRRYFKYAYAPDEMVIPTIL